MEGLELVGFFAGADEEGGDAEFLLDGDGDAAFAGAVELGDDEAVELGGFVKFFGLGEGVGAGAGVDDEDGFVGGGFVLLGKGAADFAEFFHEVVTGVEAAGGVADEVFGSLGDGGFVGFVANGGGVGLVVDLVVMGRSRRWAQDCSCSTAAARKVSAAATRTV